MRCLDSLMWRLRQLRVPKAWLDSISKPGESKVSYVCGVFFDHSNWYHLLLIIITRANSWQQSNDHVRLSSSPSFSWFGHMTPLRQWFGLGQAVIRAGATWNIKHSVVLDLSWFENGSLAHAIKCFDAQEIQWLEYFAGMGNLSVMMRACGYRSMRFDLLDHAQPPHRSSNFMDLTHQSGFAFLG